MKKCLVTLLALLLSGFLYSQDFQHFKFGDSSEKIKKEFIADSTQITHNTAIGNNLNIMPYAVSDRCSLSGVKSMFVYYLLDDKLEGVRFFTIESHDDLNKYLDDYNKIVDFLSKKYEKVETREFWKDETYKNDPTKLALAISLGQCNISTTYKDGNITIVHILKESKQDSRPIYQMIDYSTKKMMDFYSINESKEQDILRRTK